MTRPLLTLSIAFLITSCSVLSFSRGFDSIATAEPTIIDTPAETESLPILSMEEYEAMLTTDDEIAPSEPLSTETDELIPITMEEAVELNFEGSEEIPEPMPIPVDIPTEAHSNEHHLPDPSDIVRIGQNTVLPMWFVYTASALIVACLFTICYISKQRKEAYWKR